MAVSLLRETIAPLHEKITIKIKKEDYINSFEKTLKEYAKEAQLPGFRKGSVPTHIIRKKYGQDLFTKQLFDLVEEELNAFIKKEKVNLIGTPITNEPIDVDNININNPQDYEFNFEIGIRPSLNIDLSQLKGTRYKVKATPETIAKIEEEHKELYAPYETAEAIEDINNTVLALFFPAIEETPKNEKPLYSIIDHIKTSDFQPSFQSSWIGKKVKDIVPFTLLTAYSENHKEVNRILRNLKIPIEQYAEALSHEFAVEIYDIKTKKVIDLDIDKIKLIYPNDTINTMEDYRAKIATEFEKQKDDLANSILIDELYHALFDNITIELPQDFLKKYYIQKLKEEKKEENIDIVFPLFIKDITKQLVALHLKNEGDIKVEKEEVEYYFLSQIISYLQNPNIANYITAELNTIIKKYVQDQMNKKSSVEQATNEITLHKILNYIELQATIQEEWITIEELEKKEEELNKHNHHHH